MQFTDIAALADLLAAAGVIATLLFVAFQIRQNTNVIRNQAWLAIIERVAENATRPLDERVAATIDKGRVDFDGLSGAEKLIFGAWAWEFLVGVNRHIAFAEQGNLDPRYAAMVPRFLKWFFKYPGTGQWWINPDRQPFPSHYEATIAKAFSESPANED